MADATAEGVPPSNSIAVDFFIPGLKHASHRWRKHACIKTAYASAMSTTFAERLTQAMEKAGVNAPKLAKLLVNQDGKMGVSPQAVYALMRGDSKSPSAENNVRAARALSVDAFWLATGEGSAAGGRQSPFTRELLEAASMAEPYLIRQAENAARNCLDMDPLPRLESAAA